MTLIFVILVVNIRKKITECNMIRSVNPLYLRIVDIKGQFEKGKNGAWYLVISDKDEVYKKLVDILKVLKMKLQKKHGMIQNMIKIHENKV